MLDAEPDEDTIVDNFNFTIITDVDGVLLRESGKMPMEFSEEEHMQIAGLIAVKIAEFRKSGDDTSSLDALLKRFRA